MQNVRPDPHWDFRSAVVEQADNQLKLHSHFAVLAFKIDADIAL
jgi:hypothetical protein